VGVAGDKKQADIPVISGQYGMGASATHLPSEPDEMLKQFHGMYKQGKRGSDAARAVPFHVDRHGMPLDRSIGMGPVPSALHYFGPAVGQKSGGELEVDPDRIRHIVQTIRSKGGNKARQQRAAAAQGSLF
jgi:hypothetical protein